MSGLIFLSEFETHINDHFSDDLSPLLAKDLAGHLELETGLILACLNLVHR